MEWYWNNSLAKATLYYSDRITRSSYQIHHITHAHAGIYECKVSYLVAHRKVFTVSALGQLIVAGMYQTNKFVILPKEFMSMQLLLSIL